MDETAYGGKPRASDKLDTPVKAAKWAAENKTSVFQWSSARAASGRWSTGPQRPDPARSGDREHVLPSSMIFTDEWPLYKGLEQPLRGAQEDQAQGPHLRRRRHAYADRRGLLRPRQEWHPGRLPRRQHANTSRITLTSTPSATTPATRRGRCSGSSSTASGRKPQLLPSLVRGRLPKVAQEVGLGVRRVLLLDHIGGRRPGLVCRRFPHLAAHLGVPRFGIPIRVAERRARDSNPQCLPASPILSRGRFANTEALREPGAPAVRALVALTAGGGAQVWPDAGSTPDQRQMAAQPRRGKSVQARRYAPAPMGERS